MADESSDFKTEFLSLVSNAQHSEEGREQLYAFLLPQVERLAAQHLKYQVDLRDDVVQETMIAVMSAGVDKMVHPKAYLATTVRRTAMRLCQKDHAHEELHEGLMDDNDELETYENMELIARLGEVIDAMKARCRRLLNMITFKAERDEVLAIELEMKLPHIPAARYACLKSLKDQLEKKHHALCEGLKQL